MSMMEYYETAAQAEKMKADALDAAREYITGKLPKEELLAQLAEEATELAHAALKLRRVLDGTNPTPVDHITAKSTLIEEIADVTLLLQLLELGMDDYGPDIKATMNHKTLRWRDRLEESMTEKL